MDINIMTASVNTEKKQINDVKDFELLSNSEKSSNLSDDSSDDSSSLSESHLTTELSEVSTNTLFFHDLYKDNRILLRELAEKERMIAQLQERNSFLANSNMFWLCCTVGSLFSSLLSIRLTH